MWAFAFSAGGRTDAGIRMRVDVFSASANKKIFIALILQITGYE